MTRYSNLYYTEQEAHAKARAELRRANEFIVSFREFVRDRDLHRDFLEYMLVKHLGEKSAEKFMADLASENEQSQEPKT